MTIYNEMGDSQIALVTGDDAGAGVGLTNWLNAYTKFAVAEIIPCDIPLGWNYKPLSYTTVRNGVMTSSRVSDRHSSMRNPGIWMSKHALQTCQFGWWLKQTASTPTTEGTPAGYNTHVLTISAVSTPLWHGIHFERTGIASNTLIYDMMGLTPSDRVITCDNKENFDAIQEITVPFAVKIDGDDVTNQTPRPYQTTGSKWKTFDHLITGNGAGKSANLTGMLYNNLSLEFDVIGMRIIEHRDTQMKVPLKSATAAIDGCMSVGRMHKHEYSVELDVQPIGDMIYDLNGLKKESYVGDLDLAFGFIADATNDRIDYVFDKMYMVEFDEVNAYDKWLEGYTLTFEPFDNTSSMTETGIDNLDNTHFENP